ncbi:MAG: acetolactate synthase small subunit [Nitrososphaerota archaeon]|nr:acetolactate synthase small subunit [Nitrososphaerota archaeon]MDG6921799.1 acetolactate synthase small subunit [Nitrososphaerota archaeon]
MSTQPAAATAHIPANTSGEEVITAEEHKAATQIVYAIVENQRGVLHRISGMFRAKGFNITSISIGGTLAPDMARMTIVPKGDEESLKLLVKQLTKMIDVIEVGTMTHRESISRELALVKFETHETRSRNTILDLSNNLGAKAVDIARDSLVVEYSATPEQIDAFIKEASKSGHVSEIVRTGLTALKRGLQ